MGRAAAVVDVGAVGIRVDHRDVGTEPAQHVRRDGDGRSVGAVDHDPQAGQVTTFDRLDDRIGVAEQMLRRRTDRPDRVARRRPRRVEAAVHERIELGLERGLDIVAQLAAPDGEELDAVVGIPVVRRGDHRPGDALVRRRPCHHRRRHDPEGVHSCPFGREARGERRLEHRTRHAGVASDDEVIAVETRAAARPSATTSSGVRSRLATPRTPSVPKRSVNASSTAEPSWPS